MNADRCDTALDRRIFASWDKEVPQYISIPTTIEQHWIMEELNLAGQVIMLISSNVSCDSALSSGLTRSDLAW
jgi:hypothetical protein